MGGEWREVALGDLFKVKHGFAFKGEFFTDEPQPEVLVTPGNFAIGGGFQDDKRKYYRGPVPTDYVLQPGQIVVTMTDLSKQSDTLGFAARVPNDTNVWLHNQRVGLLVFSPSAEADARFVEYLLRTHEYRAWVVGSATGTTVKHTSPSRIEGFRTLVPPPDEQRAIAHILGTLDDKIELNRRRNQTLEAMARALFKDWFVDFGPVRLPAGRQAPRPEPKPGLPPGQAGKFFVYAIECENGSIYIGHAQDVQLRYEEHAKGRGAEWTKRHPPRRLAYWEECPTKAAAIAREKKLKSGSGREWLKAEIQHRDALNEVKPYLPADLWQLFPDRLDDEGKPEGWEMVPASELIEFNPTEPLRKGTPAPYLDMASLPTSGSWPESPVIRDFGSGMRFRNGDTLLARITPCLENGKTAFVQCLPDDTVGWGSTEYIVMRPKAPVPAGYAYLLARDVAFREHAIRSMTGTSGRQRAQGDSVAAFKLASPPDENVWHAFAKKVMPIFEGIKSNATASETLASLRDTLLPKLISGELRIAEAERFLARAEMLNRVEITET